MNRGGKGALLNSVDRLFRHGTASGLTDGQLLERFTSRHDEAAEAAFAVLVERHGGLVWRVCQGALADPNDAQDAFQATFLVLMKKAGSVRSHDSLSAWLYGVARRVASRSRADSARRRVVEKAAGANRPDSYAPAAAEQCDTAVWDEVDRLPGALRTAVVHCYLEGLTHEQAAARLGWPVGTVRSRLARARDRLRGRLERRGLAPTALAALPGFSRSFPWPTQLVDRTARAALTLAARDAASAGLVSAAAASLSEGVLRIMLIGTIKSAVTGVVVTGALFAGAGVSAYQDRGERPERDRPDRPEAREEVRRREIQERRVAEEREARQRRRAEEMERAELVERARLQPRGPLNEIAGQVTSIAQRADELQRLGRREEAQRLVAELRELSEAWFRSLGGGPPREGSGALTIRGRVPAGLEEAIRDRMTAQERRIEALEQRFRSAIEALEREGARRDRPAVEERRRNESELAPGRRPASRRESPDAARRDGPHGAGVDLDAAEAPRPPAPPEPPKPPVAPVPPDDDAADGADPFSRV